MRKIIFTLLFLIVYQVKGQQISDSTQLKEVKVKAYFSEQPLLRVPASISVVTSSAFENQSPTSFVPALNTLPGVRMEERSPGSYRLSIRGSLLRSPFGVRNVKVYVDDFMLTDAGGNTYLNLLDAGSANSLEIIKGPEGSIYGANTGGVVLVHTGTDKQKDQEVSAGVTGGSFGLFHQNLSFKRAWRDFQLNINQAYQRSDGYRQNSGMNRKYVHLLPQWNYSQNTKLKAFFLYSDLNYQTPGGLTLAQFEENPRFARPQSLQQNAEIFNETFLSGLSHEVNFDKNMKHVISVTASKTDFKNPTVNNYELRQERSLGLRTYFQLSSGVQNKWAVQAGFEAQQTDADVDRFDNLAGTRGDMQSSDFLKARQGFAFVHFSVTPLPRLSVESAISLNLFKYRFERFYPDPVPLSNRSFKEQWMPRLAASYLVNPAFSVRASVSRGYSPPTLEEVNPSNQEINTSIQAEQGWNHEAGFRLSLFNNKIYWDAVYFYYRLNDAIVRRVMENDTDFYLNAGGSDQHGFESELIFSILRNPESPYLKHLQLKNSYTLSYFKFDSYVNAGNNFSGNWLTGVPKNSVITSLQFEAFHQLSLYVQHTYTSKLPLNDANSIYAKSYNLLGFKASKGLDVSNARLNIFFGIDNALNEKYSLGNDLNAFGGRYFNAAATRNFYAGINVSL